MLPVVRGSFGHPLSRAWHDFDRLFDRFFSGSLVNSDGGWENVRVWDFSVTDSDKEVVVRAELPGFEDSDLDVQLHEDVLTIAAEKKQEGEGTRSYASYRRSVTLPQGIDPEKVQATYRNGVLELHLPRQEAAQPRRITVTGWEPQPTPKVEGTEAKTDA